MKKIVTFLFYLLFAIGTQSQISYLKATLDAAQEVPSNGSTATGVAIIKYDAATKFLELYGDYQGLSAAISASHIHGPAAPGVNAGVLFTVSNSGGSTGTLFVTATLTAGQETDLLAGNMYINVHSAAFPGGEIRGQLTTTTAGQTDYLTARIQGAQEVPPNGSAATGNAKLLLDKTTGMVYMTGSFTGLTTAANAAHIHSAAANIGGPVIFGISFTAGTKGTIHVSSAIAPGDQTQMIAGNAYINIHSGTYPGGEIRGQLIPEQDLVYLKANLQGGQEVPANGSTATGTVIVRYNKALNTLELKGDYQNITAAITASHIHGPAAPGANAGVLYTLTNTGGTSGTLSTNLTLTAPQEADLLNGLMYVNVHNASFPGGEVRGQLTTTSPGTQTYYLTGNFSGSQEIPSNASTATGSVTVLLDRVTSEVFLTGNFSGLAANASAAHIHNGAAGSNGPVVVSLSPTLATAGNVNGGAVVSTAFADAIIFGFAYVNIHNASFPGGEIRAQLGNQVLPVKLNYFNGYKKNNDVVLVWESTEEINLQQYEIEQQGTEPGKWISKGIIAAKKLNAATAYTFTDLPVDNNKGYGIYRLKMVDVDGKTVYSNVIKINFKTATATLSISNNPVPNGILRYVITGLPANKQAAVAIIDNTGKVVLKTTARTLMINNIAIGNLAAGMYRLVVHTDGNILQESFTK